MSNERDPRCEQPPYSHICDARCWPDQSPFDVGDYVEDATGRLFQRIGTDADPRPWRYLTARDDPASMPRSVKADALVPPLALVTAEAMQ